MGPLVQSAVITFLNLRNLRERAGSSSVAVVGVAGVVAVFIAVLSIDEGFRKTMAGSGSPDTAIVLRGGSPDEMSSILTRDQARVVSDAPGVARTPEGPAVSAELFVVVDVPKRSTGTDANVPLRGVQPSAFVVRDDIKIVEGRRFEPGRNEIVVGRGAAGQFRGLDVGNTLTWGKNAWTVVGIFDGGGTIADSEIWCDVGVLQPAYHRGDSFQAVYVKLDSPGSFPAFKDALTTDPKLDVKVQRESEYFAAQSEALTSIVNALGTLIAGLMGVGAVFGALNTMYTAVSARSREIATLRALGFRAGPVVISVLVESLLLCLAGGILGGLASYLVFNGWRTSTLNWQTFSQVAFAFAVTPRLMVEGVSYAVLLGLLGGLFPAIRAARLPVASALREL